MELVAIGSTAFLPGFALAGVQKTVLASPKDIMEKVKECNDAGIILLEEELLTDITTAQRQTLEISTNPVIIFLGRTNNQEERLRKAIINTLGVDLLK
jgi:vacuolar-type H+-ATPase subunit F/Vma7